MGNNDNHRTYYNDGNYSDANETIQTEGFTEDEIEAVFYEDFGDAEWDDESILYEAHEALIKLSQRSNRRGSTERKPKKAEQWQ